MLTSKKSNLTPKTLTERRLTIQINAARELKNTHIHFYATMHVMVNSNNFDHEIKHRLLRSIEEERRYFLHRPVEFLSSNVKTRQDQSQQSKPNSNNFPEPTINPFIDPSAPGARQSVLLHSNVCPEDYNGCRPQSPVAFQLNTQATIESESFAAPKKPNTNSMPETITIKELETLVNDL